MRDFCAIGIGLVQILDGEHKNLRGEQNVR